MAYNKLRGKTMTAVMTLMTFACLREEDSVSTVTTTKLQPMFEMVRCMASESVLNNSNIQANEELRMISFTNQHDKKCTINFVILPRESIQEQIKTNPNVSIMHNGDFVSKAEWLDKVHQ